VHFRVSTLRDGAHRIEVEGVTSHEDT
jgi:hypothetical protein